MKYFIYLSSCNFKLFTKYEKVILLLNFYVRIINYFIFLTYYFNVRPCVDVYCLFTSTDTAFFFYVLTEIFLQHFLVRICLMIQQAQSWYHLFMQNGCDVYKAVYVVFYSENVYIHLSAPHPPMLHDIYKQLVLNNFITSNLPCQMTSLKHFADERVLQLNPALKNISLNARLFFFFTVFFDMENFLLYLQKDLQTSFTS